MHTEFMKLGQLMTVGYSINDGIWLYDSPSTILLFQNLPNFDSKACMT